MTWKNLQEAMNNNSAPLKRVVKSNEQWKQILTPEQYKVTRLRNTERPFTGEYCETFSPGLYTCVCCGTAVFDSTNKYKSGTGWPSFKEPISDDVIRYQSDDTYGTRGLEVLCNVCDAHLGHVFEDGPQPSGLRFCINSASLKQVHKERMVTDAKLLETATLGGGCFWCTEAVFDELEGVVELNSGYSAENTMTSTSAELPLQSQAEVVQVRFDPNRLSYADLLRVFFATHNPTTLNRQGADEGTQYRSIILYHSETQHQTAMNIIREMSSSFDDPIITEVVPYSSFLRAEEEHVNYYQRNPDKAYCQVIITPKLQKLRSYFVKSLKKTATSQKQT